MSAGKRVSFAICRIGPGCSAGAAEVSSGTVALHGDTAAEEMEHARNRPGARASGHRRPGRGGATLSTAERMIMDHVEFDREPPANLTTMVMAFGGWIDAGQAATGALRHLVRDLSATRLAWIDPEQFFVFTQERPEVRLRADGERNIHWPRSEFFAWQPGNGRDGLLLFCGVEPHQKWRTYTKAFLDVAERCGVRRIVSIGALLAGAPHTRPIRVTGRSSDPAWRSVLEAWGIYRRPSYEGPTGIS